MPRISAKENASPPSGANCVAIIPFAAAPTCSGLKANSLYCDLALTVKLVNKLADCIKSPSVL